jgi:hypothetical protein
MSSFITQILTASSYWCETYLKLNLTVIFKNLTLFYLYFDNFQIWTAIEQYVKNYEKKIS